MPANGLGRSGFRSIFMPFGSLATSFERVMRAGFLPWRMTDASVRRGCRCSGDEGDEFTVREALTRQRRHIEALEGIWPIYGCSMRHQTRGAGKLKTMCGLISLTTFLAMANF